MARRLDNAPLATARWGGKAVFSLSFLAAVYEALFGGASAPSAQDETHPTLTRKSSFDATMVLDAIVCYTAMLSLSGLVILLCLWGLMVILF